MHDAWELMMADALGPEERAEVRALLAEEPELAAAAAHWQAVRQAVAAPFARALPESRLLVLYALAAHDEALLEPDERAEIEALRPAMARALARHPGLEALVRRIQDEALAFETAWQEALPAPPPPALPRPDRAPAARRAARPALRWVWRAAAAFSVVALLGVFALFQLREAAFVEVATGPGEMQQVMLADGSSVLLYERSRLTYAAPDAEGFSRQVRLTGKAFFEVAEAPRPFTVETETALTTVLGTRFSVEAGPAATEVVLATGKVALSPKAAPADVVVLAPGQRSRVARGAAASSPENVDLSTALAWTGDLYFHATPLRDIAARLSRRFGVPVQVDAALAGEPVTGTFRQEQRLEAILQVLATSVSARVEGDAAGYRLVP